MKQFLLACVALVVLAFCSTPIALTTAAEKEATKPKVTLELADWEKTQELVAAHKGKVVVLDVWATSCTSCVEEFPNLVKLHKRLGGQDLACISLSCDYAGIKKKPVDSYRPGVLKFLEEQGADFQNLLSTVPADDLLEQIKLPSNPAVYVYGRDGKLAKRFDNTAAKSEKDNFTYEDVSKLVEDLLAKK